MNSPAFDLRDIPEAELKDSKPPAQDDTRRFRAVLWEVAPLDIIQLACLRNARASLFFVTPEGQSGTIFIDQGRIIHAECGGHFQTQTNRTILFVNKIYPHYQQSNSMQIEMLFSDLRITRLDSTNVTEY